MFGMDDGAIRIHSLDVEFDIATLNHSWMLNVHDNNYGHVTNVKLGYDSLHLLSVGSDGNFFMFDVMTQENIDKEIAEAKAKLPSAKVGIIYIVNILKLRLVSNLRFFFFDSYYIENIINCYGYSAHVIVVEFYLLHI